MADINGLRLYPEEAVSAIASAIRAQVPTYSSSTWKVSQMASRIASIRVTSTPENIIVQRSNGGMTSGYQLDVDNFSLLRSYAFYNYSELGGVSFPSCTKVSNHAFYGCTKLKTANLPLCSSLGSYAFYKCTALLSVSLPICQYVTSYAFYGCESLSAIILPSCTSMSMYAFQGCYNLKTVSIPSLRYIPNSVFKSCSSLTTVSLPSTWGVSGYTFAYCENLSTLTLPALSVIYSNYCFRGCVRLISLYLPGSRIVSLINKSAFVSTPIGGYSTTAGQYGSVYVPSSLLASYKAATNWTTISDRIVGV